MSNHPIREINKSTITNMVHHICSLNFSYIEPIRLSSLIYEEIRIIIIQYLENILRQLYPLKSFQKDRVITEKDVLQILHFVPGMTPRLNHCTINTSKKEIKVSSKIMAEYKLISKHYEQLRKQLNKLQSNYSENSDNEELSEQINELDTKMTELHNRQDEIYENYINPAKEKRDELRQKLEIEDSCFYIFPKSFRRLIVYLGRDYLFTFTDDACLLIQFDLEYYLTKLLNYAIRAVRHAKRDTIMPRDLQLIRIAMTKYEKIISRPRFVFPESNISFKTEYIKIKDSMGIEEKTVSDKLILQLDRFNHLLIELLIEYAHVYNSIEKKSKITKRNLKIAVDSIFPGELSKHAQSEGRRSEENSSKLIFNIQTDFNLEKDAVVYLNTVIEYINAEMIDMMNSLNSTSKFYSIFEEDEEFGLLKENLGFVPIKMT